MYVAERLSAPFPHPLSHMISDLAYRGIQCGLYLAVIVMVFVASVSPQFRFDRPTGSIIVYWDFLSESSGRVPFGVNGCEERYYINRVGLGLSIACITTAVGKLLSNMPSIDFTLRRFGRWYPRVWLSFSWIAYCCAFMSAACSVILFRATLCGSSPSDFPNSGMEWGFSALCMGCVVMGIAACTETFRFLRMSRTCSFCQTTDDLLDVLIRRQRRFLL